MRSLSVDLPACRERLSRSISVLPTLSGRTWFRRELRQRGSVRYAVHIVANCAICRILDQPVYIGFEAGELLVEVAGEG